MIGGGGAGGRLGSGGATTILRGGFGEFRSPAPTSLYSSALAAPGVSTAEARLVCIGAAVPIPDWTGYLADPASIPSQCQDAVTTVAITPSPNAAVFDPGFTAPRAWRGSLGIQRRLLGTLMASLDATYARGVSQYGFRDLNLAPAPGFTLPAEGNRPVYVAVADVVPATGALSSVDSRLDARFGEVLAVESNLASDTRQLTVGLSGITGRGAAFQLSYTYTHARDQSSFSGGAASQGFAAATTAGDPNLPEWATSSFERRHSILATVTYPITGALEITTIGRLSSGAPFTPVVGSDINGDGARNDRAFIFDPTSTGDTATASSMASLLATAPANVRRLPGAPGRHRRWPQLLSRSVAAVARLSAQLASELVRPRSAAHRLPAHGEPPGRPRRPAPRRWGSARLGSATAPDPVLLYVRSFDPATQQFRYAVNGRFGSTVGANAGIVTPFQIGFQARLTIGPDPVRNRLRTAFGSRGNRGAGGAGDAGQFADRFARVMPNPIGPILERGTRSASPGLRSPACRGSQIRWTSKTGFSRTRFERRSSGPAIGPIRRCCLPESGRLSRGAASMGRRRWPARARCSRRNNGPSSRRRCDHPRSGGGATNSRAPLTPRPVPG